MNTNRVTILDHQAAGRLIAALHGWADVLDNWDVESATLRALAEDIADCDVLLVRRREPS